MNRVALQPAKTPWLYFRLSLASLLLITLTFGLIGCFGERKKEAQNLVKKGVEQSESLVKYYNSLVLARERTVELIDLDIRGRTGVGMDEPERKAVEEQIEALRARAATAQKLKNLFEALGNLIEYDAPGEIKTAVMDLKGEVVKLSGTPLKIGPISEDTVDLILGRIITYLVELEQMRQFKKNTPQVLALLDGIIEFYDTEKPLYVMIAQDYERLRPKAAAFLRSTGVELVASASSFKEDIAPYGELLIKSSTDRKLMAYQQEADNRILASRMKNTQQAADSLSNGLYQLQQSTELFLRREPHYPLLVRGELQSTASMLSYLRRALNQAKPRAGQSDDDSPAEQKLPPSDPMSHHIVSLLTPEFKKQLETISPEGINEDLEIRLMDELNRIMRTTDFHKYLETQYSENLKKSLEDFRKKTGSSPAQLRQLAAQLEQRRLNEFNMLLKKGRRNSNEGGLTLSELNQFKQLIGSIKPENRVFDKHPSGRALVTLNRMLLERAYPNQIRDGNIR